MEKVQGWGSDSGRVWNTAKVLVGYMGGEQEDVVRSEWLHENSRVYQDQVSGSDYGVTSSYSNPDILAAMQAPGCISSSFRGIESDIPDILKVFSGAAKIQTSNGGPLLKQPTADVPGYWSGTTLENGCTEEGKLSWPYVASAATLFAHLLNERVLVNEPYDSMVYPKLLPDCKLNSEGKVADDAACDAIISQLWSATYLYYAQWHNDATDGAVPAFALLLGAVASRIPPSDAASRCASPEASFLTENGLSNVYATILEEAGTSTFGGGKTLDNKVLPDDGDSTLVFATHDVMMDYILAAMRGANPEGGKSLVSKYSGVPDWGFESTDNQMRYNIMVVLEFLDNGTVMANGLGPSVEQYRTGFANVDDLWPEMQQLFDEPMENKDFLCGFSSYVNSMRDQAYETRQTSDSVNAFLQNIEAACSV